MKKILLLILIWLYPILGFAIFDETKTDVYFINGVDTSKRFAEEQTKMFETSKEIEKRYPTSDGIVKPYYAKILALLKPNESRTMIEKDMDNEMEGNRKIKLISAFAKTGINDDYVINKLMDMIYNTIPNSHFHPFEKELFSSAVIYSLAKSINLIEMIGL